MAAAALYRSRGAAGVRAIKGPFFIFTLLCLVGLATSHIDKETLVKLKKHLQNAQGHLDRLKAQYKSEIGTSDFFNQYMSLMDPLTEYVRTVSQNSPDGFPSLDELLHCLKGFMEKVKTYSDKQNKVLGERIKDGEHKLSEYRTRIKMLEEQQEEL